MRPSSGCESDLPNQPEMRRMQPPKLKGPQRIRPMSFLAPTRQRASAIGSLVQPAR